MMNRSFKDHITTSNNSLRSLLDDSREESIFVSLRRHYYLLKKEFMSIVVAYKTCGCGSYFVGLYNSLSYQSCDIDERTIYSISNSPTELNMFRGSRSIRCFRRN